MTLAATLILGLLGQAAANPQVPADAADHVQQPRKLKHVAPKYPEEARRAGLTQDVVLECQVDPQGLVNDVVVVKGVPPLAAAAVEAVKQWQYEPTLVDETPVSVTITVTVRFHVAELRYADLISSLESGNEFVREAAAFNLGGPEVEALIHQPNYSRVLTSTIRELEKLADEDESLRVRAAAARSLARLDTSKAASAIPDRVEPEPGSSPETAPAPDTEPPPAGALDQPPKVRKQARPEYPQDAFVKGIEGTVLVEALIDVEGRVTRCRVLQSVPELDAAALAAVKQWRFEPAMKGGKPVATLIHMPVAFRIYGKKE